MSRRMETVARSHCSAKSHFSHKTTTFLSCSSKEKLTCFKQIKIQPYLFNLASHGDEMPNEPNNNAW